MIQFQEVEKSYGAVRALDGLNLSVPDGAVYALVGPNASGKSTCMRLLMGIELPDKGEVSLDDMRAGSDLRRLKRRVGYVQDSPGSYPGLQIRDYMSFFASCFELSGTQVKRRIQFLLEQAGLSGREGQRVDSLPRGMQQKLAIARALIHDPRILILDEPTEGLDPRSRVEIKRLISDLSEEGKTVFLSSRSLSEFSDISTHIGILEQGKMLVEGELTEVLGKVNASSPIILSVEGSLASAMRVLKKDKKVRSISIRRGDIRIGYNGKREEETGLLENLVKEGIPVRSFHREEGDLETLFRELNGKQEERMVTSFDAESDI